MRKGLSLLFWTFLVSTMLAPSVFAAKDYRMVITNEVAVTHWKTGLMKDLAKLIEKRSEGRIDVKLYSGGQLFTDKAAIKSIGTGAVHMVWPASVNLEPLRLEYGVVNLPFAINDELVLNKPQFRKELLSLLSNILNKEGINVMGLLRADELAFVFKDYRPKTVADMRGLKVRVIGGQVLLDWVGELGVTPISMPASEFTTALSQGVIDGIQTTSGGWARMIGELGEYGIVVPDLLVLTYSILLDSNWFRSIPEDLQKVVVDSVDDIASKQWQYSIEQSEKDYEKITGQFKSKVFRVPQDQVPVWSEKVQVTYERFAEKFPEVYKKYVDLNKNSDRIWPPKK